MKKITIYAKTIENQKFLEYGYKNKKGQYYRVKFRSDCNQYPKDKGYWSIEFEKENASIENGRLTKEGYNIPATLWIHKLSKFEKDEEAEKQAIKNRQAALDEALDDTQEDSDLPF